MGKRRDEEAVVAKLLLQVHGIAITTRRGTSYQKSSTTSYLLAIIYNLILVSDLYIIHIILKSSKIYLLP